MGKQPFLIVTLDHATEEEALNFLPELDPSLCHVKIGSILFTHYGPSLLHKIMHRGFKLFFRFKISRYSSNGRRGMSRRGGSGCLDVECPCRRRSIHARGGA